ncbi:proline-rich receptor-like protein kinase PERK8 [Humulus lupulus]|uniref:proline-rich receptor-like protein kinase PERK8 n=1 Tax=Humulus lupulus TaxID=3486 RepID=UPI002B407088|nr:proline-rich receptor-like protein kinase PERK8 [Humulus lupulus]
MGRVKSIAQRKKKTANPSSNQPSPRTENPSPNPQPVNTGKGKQKLPEHPEPILESSDENVMPSDDAFDLYSQPKTTAPASRKKESRRHPGEGSSNPSKKRARTEDLHAPAPSKETTPPPAPIDQTPLPAPVDSTPPPAPVDQNPPDQSGNTQGEATINIAFN